jgi:hypothetical protein
MRKAKKEEMGLAEDILAIEAHTHASVSKFSIEYILISPL